MKTIFQILIAVLFIFAVSQVRAQDCLPKLIKASKDTTFTVNDSNLLLIERPTNDTYQVTMKFVKVEPIITTVSNTELTYTGLWTKASGTGWSVAYSSEVGATAKYSFTGNRVQVICDLDPSHGTMLYKINSGLEKSASLYSSVRKNAQIVIDELVPPGFNTITMKVLTPVVLIDYLRIQR